MSDHFDSIYPDLLRAGVREFSALGSNREVAAFFSALEAFRRDLHDERTQKGLLSVSQRYVEGLDLFHSIGFWLVQPADLSFALTLAAPEQEGEVLERIVGDKIRTGRFAKALRQNAPVYFQEQGSPERGILQSLRISKQVMGMFCGLLHPTNPPAREIRFSLLSLLLGGSADALATLRKTEQLTNQIEALSGLLPLCAWCKKVRNDSGYWEQIEKYISEHSSTQVTHGMCPECQTKFLADLSKTREVARDSK